MGKCTCTHVSMQSLSSHPPAETPGSFLTFKFVFDGSLPHTWHNSWVTFLCWHCCRLLKTSECCCRSLLRPLANASNQLSVGEQLNNQVLAIIVTLNVIFFYNLWKPQERFSLKGRSVNVSDSCLNLKNNFLIFFILFFFGASGFQRIIALQEVIRTLTQIWSPTSCSRRLIHCQQTSAVHLHSLTGNAGPRLPRAPRSSPFRSFPGCSLMFVFASLPSAPDDFWKTEFNTQKQAESKKENKFGWLRFLFHTLWMSKFVHIFSLWCSVKDILFWGHTRLLGCMSELWPLWFVAADVQVFSASHLLGGGGKAQTHNRQHLQNLHRPKHRQFRHFICLKINQSWFITTAKTQSHLQ